MAFRGVDYFCGDSLLSEEELMVRQTARRFADEQILPLIRDCYRDARFPAGIVPEMAELGFLGANLEGYGCAGMSNVEYGLVMQELERADSGIRSFASVTGSPCGMRELRQAICGLSAVGRPSWAESSRISALVKPASLSGAHT